jgi:hypothetical protein
MAKRVFPVLAAALARRLCFGSLVLCLGLGSLHAAMDLYVETAIDPSGQLRITTKRRREIVPKRESGQVRFDDARISPDGRAVGWLASYADAGGSSPLPLKLVVLFNGEQRSFTGSGLPISGWSFWAGGKQVAFKQETLHGGMGLRYELRDVATGELADKYDPDSNPASITKPPRWVVVVDSGGEPLTREGSDGPSRHR